MGSVVVSLLSETVFCSVDVILFSGDAYIDHPSFGIAVIGRILEREGY
ncbi:MAG: hypothetical protein IJ957_07605, partial [Rikenellaceae bacterium]|nr:hypothetical protein [Rikenellaceae bacterium]